MLDTSMSEYDRYLGGNFGGTIIKPPSEPIMEGGGSEEVVRGEKFCTMSRKRKKCRSWWKLGDIREYSIRWNKEDENN